jgi:hypothetical protein
MYSFTDKGGDPIIGLCPASGSLVGGSSHTSARALGQPAPLFSRLNGRRRPVPARRSVRPGQNCWIRPP